MGFGPGRLDGQGPSEARHATAAHQDGDAISDLLLRSVDLPCPWLAPAVPLSFPQPGRVVCKNLRPVYIRLRRQQGKHSFRKTTTEGVANAARPETGGRAQHCHKISRIVKERLRPTGKTARGDSVTEKGSRKKSCASIVRELCTELLLIQIFYT